MVVDWPRSGPPPTSTNDEIKKLVFKNRRISILSELAQEVNVSFKCVHIMTDILGMQRVAERARFCLERASKAECRRRHDFSSFYGARIHETHTNKPSGWPLENELKAIPQSAYEKRTEDWSGTSARSVLYLTGGLL